MISVNGTWFEQTEIPSAVILGSFNELLKRQIKTL
jgi:hypothetical protein